MKRTWRWWLRRLSLAFVACGALLGAVFFVSTDYGAAFGARAAGVRLARMEASPQRRDGVFVNTRPTKLLGLSDSGGVLREWLLGAGRRSPAGPLPVLDSVAKTISRAPESSLRVTWLGHSTLLIEIDGARLLTDPVFGPRASPSTLVGPPRFHRAPISISELGRIDAVLISHDHYDHLDMPTIRELAATDTRFLVPLGVGAHLERWGVALGRINEHDWWQESQVGAVRAVATPAQHFSGRGLGDGNTTLWASWTLVGPRQRVFFSGDTGQAPEFPEVGKRFGPFDLALLEIGAYHPAWGDIHLGPEHAIEIMSELRARRLLPVHWGTFDLGLHPWAEPAETLSRLARERGVELITPRIGESVEPERGTRTSPWWRELASAP